MQGHGAGIVGAGSGAESRALTGLRGVAAILVMLHHVMLHLHAETGIPALQALLMRGYLGVDLFFVLSGFVMAMTYGTWFDGTHGVGVGVARYVRFMTRRAARLWPLHATVLLLFVAAGLGDPVFPFSGRQFLANLAMIQAWDVSRAINPPAWSVSAELFAYAVFPLLVALTLRGRLRPLLCLAGVAAALAVCMHGGPPLSPGRRGLLDVYFNDSPLPLLRCLAGFTAGMLAWRSLRLGLVRRLAAWPGTGPLFLAAAPAAVVLGAGDGVVFVLLPFVVLGLHAGRGLAYRVLGHGPLHRLGVLSYAIYLLHVFVLDHVDIAPGETAAEMITLAALTLVAATVAHRVVEVPGRRLIRHAGEVAMASAAALAPHGHRITK